MTNAPRFLDLGVALGIAVGLLAGFGVVAPSRAAEPTPSSVPGVPSGAAPSGALAAPPVGGNEPSSGTVSGSAIAYPAYPGSPGLAPDHTIVVTGVGQADLKADGSDQASAQKRALEAALADAKAQADVIAAATGLSISGVLSVSASVWPDYGVVPMVGTNGGAQPPEVLPVPPVTQTLSVSVTVAYRVG